MSFVPCRRASVVLSLNAYVCRELTLIVPSDAPVIVFSIFNDPSKYATRVPSWERTTMYGLTVFVRTKDHVEFAKL